MRWRKGSECSLINRQYITKCENICLLPICKLNIDWKIIWFNPICFQQLPRQSQKSNKIHYFNANFKPNISKILFKPWHTILDLNINFRQKIIKTSSLEQPKSLKSHKNRFHSAHLGGNIPILNIEITSIFKNIHYRSLI